MSNENPMNSREKFEEAEGSLEQKKKAIVQALESGDYDSVSTLAQEAKGMEQAKSEMVGDAHSEALEMNRQVDEEKAAEEKASREAAAAEAARLDAEKSQQEAAALLAKMQGGGVEAPVVESAEPAQEAFTLSPEAQMVEEALMRLAANAEKAVFNRDPELETTRAAIGGFDEQTQEKLAEDFFDRTIGQSIANNRGAYQIYMEMPGGAFTKKFHDLEDARLKAAGYAGFSL